MSGRSWHGCADCERSYGPHGDCTCGWAAEGCPGCGRTRAADDCACVEGGDVQRCECCGDVLCELDGDGVCAACEEEAGELLDASYAQPDEDEAPRLLGRDLSPASAAFWAMRGRR